MEELSSAWTSPTSNRPSGRTPEQPGGAFVTNGGAFVSNGRARHPTGRLDASPISLEEPLSASFALPAGDVRNPLLATRSGQERPLLSRKPLGNSIYLLQQGPTPNTHDVLQIPTQRGPEKHTAHQNHVGRTQNLAQGPNDGSGFFGDTDPTEAPDMRNRGTRQAQQGGYQFHPFPRVLGPNKASCTGQRGIPHIKRLANRQIPRRNGFSEKCTENTAATRKGQIVFLY